MDEKRLKVLESQREYTFRAMQILFDLSKEIKVDASQLPNFCSRMTRLESIREEFATVTESINEVRVAIDPEVVLDHKTLLAFDDLYYYVLAVYEEMNLKRKDETRARADCTGAGSGNSDAKSFHARLPKLELPKFDGNIENWPTFYDTFLSLIHENKSIASIEKFHYLISCLSGSALAIAKGVPVTGDNYEHVFDTLKERYQNKRLLAVTYIEKIQNFPQIKNSNLNDLQKFYNTLYETVNALKTLKIKNLDEFLLFHLASRALDSDTRKRFEIQNESVTPSYEELLTFLQGYVKVLETSQPPNTNAPARSSQPAQAKTNKTSDGRPTNNTQKRSALTSQNTTNNKSAHPVECLCCGSDHSVYKCPKFQSMSLTERQAWTNDKKVCINCLRKNHVVEKCFSKVRCQTCSNRHHTLLHPEPQLVQPNVDHTATSNSGPTVAHVGRNRDTALVLLGTCTVRVCDISGTPHQLRALIDSGAQDCYITTACAKQLGYPLRRCRLTVAGIGENTVTQVKGVTECTVQPCDAENPKFHIKPIVLDSITTKMPVTELPAIVKQRFKHLTLADEQFDTPSDIQLLLGAEHFHNIYDGQRVKLEPGLPVALHSVFGWILTGPVNVANKSSPLVTSSLLASTLNLDSLVKRFWEIEEPPQVRLCSPEDEECERLYTKLTYRDQDGRYVVPLLLKEPRTDLGQSYNTSLSRLLGLERRLSRLQDLKSQYVEFMKEYEILGHMERVVESVPSENYYIPHHCVIKPESTTTKLRVVFNASSQSSNGLSLNDLVYTGPKLQADIVDIITGFRLHHIVFTCDISKMYRQIMIRPEDRSFQHVLWRSSPVDPISDYELRTVTYGVSSSPYLAIRTLRQLADDNGSRWPRAADALRYETYMDDITTGAPNLEAAISLKDDLVELLGCAQLELRKWTSNSAQFLEQLPLEHCQSPKFFSEESDRSTLKILGVQWEPRGDYFTYSISQVDVEYTKRSILSNVARIFDPLGWVNPYILIAKLLLQDLWRHQLSWDDAIPDDLARDWRNFLLELSNLPLIQLPRHIVPGDLVDSQLLGFCDGSTKAYGCCVYLRSTDRTGTITVRLLVAKSKVAPLKPLTVNRLELCGAVLLSRVLSHMNSLLAPKMNLKQPLAYTDSSTVLAWLNTEPHRLKTFVAHRVVKITDAIPANQWHHVATQDNPADHCSRGLSCSELVHCDQWWSGPSWLSQDPSQWPTRSESEVDLAVPELKSTTLLTQSTESADDEVLQNLTKRCSSLSQLQRILAWCKRFIINLRSSVKQPSNRIQGPLSVLELDEALRILVKSAQAKAFGSLSVTGPTSQTLPRTMRKLSPFVDPHGVLRVGGRIKNAEVPENTKHPYLLPKRADLSNLIVDSLHKKYLHCGPRSLQSLILRQFWILGIRNLIRSRLSKCVICFKNKPQPFQPVMGDLPSLRLVRSGCFQSVGVDFGGPFLIKESRRRNAKTFKAYICLFVCLTVKAVHLELVTELSSEAFIAALDRFVARRGLCHTIISDRGTNFVGAKRYLNEITELLRSQNDVISNNLSSKGISWKLNPASAPHFGGIFESGIKSTKYHLKRVVGSQTLTFEEFTTVLVKIEAMLNSRPLCELSSDPNELNVLTPGHFIIGRPLVSLPEPVFEDNNMTLRTRWRLLQRLSQSFWKTWQRDYLHTLQQRKKWYTDNHNIPSVGDIVMIVEAGLPPCEWRLGRIVQLHPGKDNIVRVVTVRTANGSLTRPLVKICPLPLSSS